MQKVWMCEWEILPGGGKQKKKFKTYGEAKAFVRKMISENVDIDGIIKRLQSKYNNKYTHAIVEFLTKYITDIQFPYSEKDLPSVEPWDYDDYPEDCNDFDTYPDDEFSQNCLSDENDVSISADSLHFLHGGYDLASDFVLEEPDFDKMNGKDCFLFTYLNDSDGELTIAPGLTKDMRITLTNEIEWGTAANPVMILRVLQNKSEPMLQTDIIEEIEWKYGPKIERKAVGRNIEMLNALGYNISKSRKGYLLIND